jgi:hypothetical protein
MAEIVRDVDLSKLEGQPTIRAVPLFHLEHCELEAKPVSSGDVTGRGVPEPA